MTTRRTVVQSNELPLVSGSPSREGFLSRLSSETVGNRERLKVFLTGLRVSDLKQELQTRDIPLKGLSTKSHFINKLLDLLPLSTGDK